MLLAVRAEAILLTLILKLGWRREERRTDERKPSVGMPFLL